MPGDRRQLLSVDQEMDEDIHCSLFIVHSLSVIAGRSGDQFPMNIGRFPGNDK
jgi:hypothetical protein